MVPITIVNGVYKQSYTVTGGPHIVPPIHRDFGDGDNHRRKPFNQLSYNDIGHGQGYSEWLTWVLYTIIYHGCLIYTLWLLNIAMV